RTEENEMLAVTRVRCMNTEEFREISPSVVARIHAKNPIDLIEVPEYGAEGLHMKQALPDVPLVVKLHTPRYQIKELNDHYYDRKFVRRIKRGLGMVYKKEEDPEYKAIQSADHILSPSRSLIKLVEERWGIAPGRIKLAPNPYVPSKELMSIQPDIDSNTILYAGRLETRKGVYNLAKAVPLVVKAIPEAKFIFLGRDSRGPMREASMKKVMMREMGDAGKNAEFIDHIPLDQVASVYARSGICVYPSLWENFPNVCLEAMTAARPVVASSEGGMVDMLEDTGGGIMIDPHDPASIANGIIQGLKDKPFREKAARANREKASSYYGLRLREELIALYSDLD